MNSQESVFSEQEASIAVYQGIQLKDKLETKYNTVVINGKRYLGDAVEIHEDYDVKYHNAMGKKGNGLAGDGYILCNYLEKCMLGAYNFTSEFIQEFIVKIKGIEVAAFNYDTYHQSYRSLYSRENKQHSIHAQSFQKLMLNTEVPWFYAPTKNMKRALWALAIKSVPQQNEYIRRMMKDDYYEKIVKKFMQKNNMEICQGDEAIPVRIMGLVTKPEINPRKKRSNEVPLEAVLLAIEGMDDEDFDRVRQTVIRQIGLRAIQDTESEKEEEEVVQEAPKKREKKAAQKAAKVKPAEPAVVAAEPEPEIVVPEPAVEFDIVMEEEPKKLTKARKTKKHVPAPQVEEVEEEEEKEPAQIGWKPAQIVADEDSQYFEVTKKAPPKPLPYTYAQIDEAEDLVEDQVIDQKEIPDRVEQMIRICKWADSEHPDVPKVAQMLCSQLVGVDERYILHCDGGQFEWTEAEESDWANAANAKEEYSEFFINLCTRSLNWLSSRRGAMNPSKKNLSYFVSPFYSEYLVDESKKNQQPDARGYDFHNYVFTGDTVRQLVFPFVFPTGRAGSAGHWCVARATATDNRAGFYVQVYDSMNTMSQANKKYPHFKVLVTRYINQVVIPTAKYCWRDAKIMRALHEKTDIQHVEMQKQSLPHTCGYHAVTYMELMLASNGGPVQVTSLPEMHNTNLARHMALAKYPSQAKYLW